MAVFANTDSVALQHKWPNVSPVPSSSKALVTSKHDIHPVKKAWLQCVLQHPVSFYALLYASSKHLAFLYNGNEEHFSHASLLRLSYKTEAVKLINESLRTLNGQPIPDHLLIAILSLGAHGNEEKRPSNPPKPVTTSPPSTVPIFPPRHSSSPESTATTTTPRASTSSPSTATSSSGSSSTTSPPSSNHHNHRHRHPTPPLQHRESPLARAQMLHFYGRLNQEAAHMSALRTLIAHNNGTTSIELPGLAGAVELGDILNSTITHRRPCVDVPQPITPAVRPFLALDRRDDDAAAAGGSSLLSALGGKMVGVLLPEGRQSGALLDGMVMCRAVVGALDAFVVSQARGLGKGREKGKAEITLTDLTISRNAAHYAILSLAPANALWGPQFALYEAMRVGMLVFSDFVLFPLPETTGVRRRYVRGLREAVEALEVGFKGGWAAGGEVLGVVGWCVMMGALAAEGEGEHGVGLWECEEERSGEGDVAFFVGRVKTNFGMLGASTWTEVHALLARWLWWDWLLGERGMALWEAKRRHVGVS